MLRRVALLLILLAISGGALFAARHLGIPLPWDIASTDPDPSSKDREAVSSKDAPAGKDDAEEPAKSAEKTVEDTTAALSPEAPASSEAPGSSQSSGVSIDISRISPDGTSVIAGHAEPDSYVTVLENGKPAGTAKTDSGGNWSLATEYRFASADPNLSYEVSRTPPPETPKPEAEVAAKAPERPSEANAAGEVMRKFEDLVEEAREEAKKSEETRKGEETAKADDDAQQQDSIRAPTEAEPPQTPAASSKSSDVAEKEEPAAEVKPQEQVTATSEPQADQPSHAPDVEPAPSAEAKVAAAPQESAPAEQTVIPVPIMFVYNEAKLTPDGERAAALLLEYLKLKKLSAVELTGHADERGSDAYNLDLSRERLDAVAEILKDGGYMGSLKLTPKGKSEPYMGVDRSAYSGEALFQLDRRVELRLNR